MVMEFLSGGSLKDRISSGAGGQPEPMALRTLRDWLLEIAKAIDFLHAQNHIHRDVKPANILFDRHGNAFLSDFGIIKAMETDDGDWQGNSLTAPGFLVGTPNYVAPEIVMGRRFDGRVDQYSLAMTVHEALTGTNCMEGPTPSATVVNQTMVVPPPLAELIPGIPKRVSDAILRALAKDPAERFENCVAFAQELLSAVPSGEESAQDRSVPETTSRGRPGRVPCPACEAPMPVGREHSGGRVRCVHCQATSLVSLLSSTTVQLKLVDVVGSSSGSSTAIILGADDGPAVSAVAATLVAHPVVAGADAADGRRPASRKRLAIAAASVLGFGVLFALWLAIGRGPWKGATGADEPEFGGSARASERSAEIIGGGRRATRDGRDQHRLWHRKAAVARGSDCRISQDDDRQLDRCQPSRHGLDGGGSGRSGWPRVDSDPRLVAGL